MGCFWREFLNDCRSNFDGGGEGLQPFIRVGAAVIPMVVGNIQILNNKAWMCEEPFRDALYWRFGGWGDCGGEGPVVGYCGRP